MEGGTSQSFGREPGTFITGGVGLLNRVVKGEKRSEGGGKERQERGAGKRCMPFV
jgi:hypothetical protein